jgi:RND family efflux transporter MFP subunit
VIRIAQIQTLKIQAPQDASDPMPLNFVQLLKSSFIVLALLVTTAPPAMSQTALVVDIVVAQSVIIERGISLTGEIVARDALSVSFPSGGRIDSVEVTEGDVVTAGTVLARIADTQQTQALRSARAAVLTATADRDQALEDLRRQESLLTRGATTRVSRDAAADQARVKEGVLAQASADLDLAQKALEDTVITAPEAATVTARHVEPGQVVGAVQPVVELALGSAVDAIFEAPESLLSGANDIQSMQIAPLGRPDQAFQGTVREVSPLVDPTTGTVAIKVSVEQRPSGVEFGDAVRGSTTETAGEGIVLPYNTMSATAHGPAVWIVDPDTMTVSLRDITVDRFETGWIVVKNGIDEGTLVVSAGAQLLFPNRLVQGQRGVDQ